jgi:hypothetical protein
MILNIISERKRKFEVKADKDSRRVSERSPIDVFFQS